MSENPDFQAQFRSEETKAYVYMGGVSVGCGDHPSLPKRHRWSAVRNFGRFRDRYCLTCGLTKGVDMKGQDL